MRALLSAIGLVVISGCVTPSIPIPPPDPARMSFGITGDPGDTKASFSYPPNVNFVDSIVFVYNRDLGVHHRGGAPRRLRWPDGGRGRQAGRPDGRLVPA